MTSLADIRRLSARRLTRREWFRTLGGAWGACLAVPSAARAVTTRRPATSILDQFLGETLHYQIGFWLFSHCGDATMSLAETSEPGIYKASMLGRTAGFVDWLLGRYRYAYISYLSWRKPTDRFRPIRFELHKKRSHTATHNSVTFDYGHRELIFAESLASGQLRKKRRPMKPGRVYEDYLTLFYNFRHGCYGPIERGKTYHLPLYIHETMNYLDLHIGSRQEAQKQRQQEANQAGKDYFVRFKVHGEDVSSKSGEIEGWLTKDAVPVKGTIKDVIFFGDLWGDLISRRRIIIST